MAVVTREVTPLLRKLSRQFRSVAIVGPRQSGKSTLARTVFPGKPYFSFENPSTRSFFEEDPEGFLHTHRNGAIFDEVQRVPQLFSYLQQVLDESKKTGRFILTGSNNFALQEGITQTLAGRIAYIDLLPMSLSEIRSQNRPPYRNTPWSYILRGGYPEVATKRIDFTHWFPSYIRTYIERDVRQIKMIDGLAKFEKMLLLCAGRTGQMLNMTSLALEVGVKSDTIHSWLGLLENSYIIHLLKPYHVNFNKRVVKTPKLYFHDTGLACSLLGIRTEKELVTHYMKGPLFENFILNEMMKNSLNRGRQSKFWFWRDNTGNEIDVLRETGRQILPVEIKAGMTVTGDYFKGLDFWQRTTGGRNGVVLYGGKVTQERSSGFQVMGWESIADM